MGSRRQGLARTQAMIENLKRELAMGGTQLAGTKESFMELSSNTTLTTADSGKVIMLNGSTADSNFTVTLPTPAKGLTFKFVLKANSASDTEIQIDAGSGNTIRGTFQVPGNSSFASSHASNQYRGFGDSAKQGDTLELVCTGTDRWMATIAHSRVTWITSFS
tara:strand:- start:459 stop:947 length:489 start_codon:yes stop_codon:yes gene_type:complete